MQSQLLDIGDSDERGHQRWNPEEIRQNQAQDQNGCKGQEIVYRRISFEASDGHE